MKITGKAENYAISTLQQLEQELSFLPGSGGESELNGKKSVIWIKWTIYVYSIAQICYIERLLPAGTSRSEPVFKP